MLLAAIAAAEPRVSATAPSAVSTVSRMRRSASGRTSSVAGKTFIAIAAARKGRPHAAAAHDVEVDERREQHEDDDLDVAAVEREQERIREEAQHEREQDAQRACRARLWSRSPPHERHEHRGQRPDQHREHDPRGPSRKPVIRRCEKGVYCR